MRLFPWLNYSGIQIELQWKLHIKSRINFNFIHNEINSTEFIENVCSYLITNFMQNFMYCQDLTGQ